MNLFQKRINYQGKIKPLLLQVCKDFTIGKYISHEIVPIGYEDFNLFLTTDIDKYFIKIFGFFRDKKECDRYVGIIEKALKAGVSHPKLIQSNLGYLYETVNNGLVDRLCLMEYIDGNIFYELQSTPSNKEKSFIIKQASLINQIDLHPSLIYDHWAITSLLKEYKEKGEYLTKQDRDFIRPLIHSFKSIDIDKLPHCFVHGDITKTNTMRSKKGDIFILDFAVANYYPRIQELAVILCDLFFDPKQVDIFPESYRLTINEYQKYVKLTREELSILPTYVKLAHAMHVLLANYEKIVNDNNSVENAYFLRMGRTGLSYTNQLWS